MESRATNPSPLAELADRGSLHAMDACGCGSLQGRGEELVGSSTLRDIH